MRVAALQLVLCSLRDGSPWMRVVGSPLGNEGRYIQRAVSDDIRSDARQRVI